MNYFSLTVAILLTLAMITSIIQKQPLLALINLGGAIVNIGLGLQWGNKNDNNIHNTPLLQMRKNKTTTQTKKHTLHRNKPKQPRPNKTNNNRIQPIINTNNKTRQQKRGTRKMVNGRRNLRTNRHRLNAHKARFTRILYYKWYTTIMFFM